MYKDGVKGYYIQYSLFIYNKLHTQYLHKRTTHSILHHSTHSTPSMTHGYASMIRLLPFVVLQHCALKGSDFTSKVGVHGRAGMCIPMANLISHHPLPLSIPSSKHSYSHLHSMFTSIIWFPNLTLN